MYLNLARKPDYIVVVAHILYVVLTGFAMVYYPGGHIFDLQSEGYSFSQNFFSDMGYAKSLSGVDNTISAYLFSSAVYLAAIGQFVFYLDVYKKNLGGPVIKSVSLFFGAVSALGMLLLAYFPNDTHQIIHIVGVYLWSLAFLVYVSLFNFTILTSFARPAGLLLISAPLYVLVLIQIAQDQFQWFSYMAITQKVMVYYIIFWFFSVILMRRSKC